MANVRMSNAQALRVESLLSLFVKVGAQKAFVPREFVLQLKVMEHMAKERLPFSEVEFGLLEIVFEMYFGVFEDYDVDPLSEQAYAKITGYWPSDILNGPWYDRVVEHGHRLGFKPPKDAREKLGY